MIRISVHKLCVGILGLTFVITACGPVTPVPQVVPTTLAVESTETANHF